MALAVASPAEPPIPSIRVDAAVACVNPFLLTTPLADLAADLVVISFEAVPPSLPVIVSITPIVRPLVTALFLILVYASLSFSISLTFASSSLTFSPASSCSNSANVAPDSRAAVAAPKA